MMIYHAAKGQTVAIDRREKAPAATTSVLFAGMPNSLTVESLSSVAVGMPGMERGTELALQRYGRLRWRKCCSRPSSWPTRALRPRRAT